MKESSKHITKDIACAKTILNEIRDKDIVHKDELLSKETSVFINDATLSRAIRELARLNVLERRKNGYKVHWDNIGEAHGQLDRYYTRYLADSKIKERLSKNTVFVREEINELLPELTIQQIDKQISELLKAGFIEKYGSLDSRGKYVIASKKEDIYIPNVISKLADMYDDVIICYNTALEYYNLSRYATSRVIYADGEVKSPMNEIFDKKIQKVKLKDSKIGIDFIRDKNFRITDKERTIIDCIRFSKYALGWENVFHAIRRLKNFDENKIIEYLRNFKSSTLTSKIGAIFENYNKYLDLSPRFYSQLQLTKSKTPFRIEREYPGKLNKNWNIYIPENFFDYD
ncbi:MAG: hypothetical protein HN691_11005 [Bacteroidetes bacterium]|jgi:predicted transcriptional regulator of viral defense system|nr:hypothetical protein [Bacteroidota bacterium]MBT4728249.1 hypothetical protein [Bacteroidota bacterium]MBT7995394.1 hypothetical protein [Bacteroidota bacterium]